MTQPERLTEQYCDPAHDFAGVQILEGCQIAEEHLMSDHIHMCISTDQSNDCSLPLALYAQGREPRRLMMFCNLFGYSLLLR